RRSLGLRIGVLEPPEGRTTGVVDQPADLPQPLRSLVNLRRRLLFGDVEGERLDAPSGGRGLGHQLGQPLRPPGHGQDGVAPARGARAVDGGTPPAQPSTTRCGDWQVVEAPLRGSIAAGLAGVGPDGGALAALYARIFMWDLDLRHDLTPGDQMRVLWKTAAEGDLEIGAAQYTSGHLGRTLRAYRFRGPGDGFASYWDDHGVEIPRRLKAETLHDHDQI